MWRIKNCKTTNNYEHFSVILFLPLIFDFEFLCLFDFKIYYDTIEYLIINIYTIYYKNII